jgi:phenylalanyl-tRNA synthetase alpha chain
MGPPLNARRLGFISSTPLRLVRPSTAPRHLSCPVRRAQWRACEGAAPQKKQEKKKAPPPPPLELGALKDEVAAQLAAGLAELDAAETLRELEDTRVKFMGKKGLLVAVLKSVGRLSKEERPLLGSVVNVAKEEFNEKLAVLKEDLTAKAAARRFEDDEEIDVTLPGLRQNSIGHIHPLNSTMDKAVDIFIKLGYDLIDEFSEYNREIEEDWYCFEALNCPKDHPARDMQDTFYLDKDKNFCLRTQTSAIQIRYMMDEKNKPPFAIIAPGRVYRRDSVDATHTPVFHQIEILHVRPKGELNVGGLRATIIHFLKEMLGHDIKTRFRGSYFPFTEPSMEVDVFFRGKWLEVLGCGMVDPQVLINVGIDPEEYTGFAAGFGVERFAMVIHQIPDIREFFKSDLRFLEQWAIESYHLDQLRRDC